MPISERILRAQQELLDQPYDLHIMHLLSALQYLKQIKHVPTKFNADEFCNYEITLSSLLLHMLESSPVDRNHLAYAAYISFLLDCVMFIGTEDHRINLDEAIDKYKKHEHNRLGLMLDEVIIRSMAHPDATKVPNVIRAIFLIQYINFIVLPRIINGLQHNNVLSFREHRTQTIEYYRHLTSHFIPNLFMILRLPGVISDIRIIGQLSKLLLQFPLELFPHIVQYIISLNKFALTNIDSLSIAEIFGILKLNEFTEVCNSRVFLTPTDKSRILLALATKRNGIDICNVGLLMGMQFTIFTEFKHLMLPFSKGFLQYYTHQKERFESEEKIRYAELYLHAVLLQHLPSECATRVKLNHICHKTGREIDIAYVDPTSKKPIKVAINIDGKDYHYYLGTQAENRKTQVRNTVLGNAGWIVICQPLERATELQGTDFDANLLTVAYELLSKLTDILPLQAQPSITAPALESGSPARKFALLLS